MKKAYLIILGGNDMWKNIKNILLLILAIILGIFGIRLLNKKSPDLDKAKDKIDKAGDDYEAELFEDGDSAAGYIDDILNKLKRK